MASKRKQKVDVKEFIGIGPELKHTIRKMIRDAIRWQNKQVLFTCRDCCFYVCKDEEHFKQAKCSLNNDNQLVMDKRMPTQLPECFLFDPLASSFVGVLNLMYSLGIDTITATRGWATIIGRLAARQDKYGYITGITQKNLDKYGTE